MLPLLLLATGAAGAAAIIAVGAQRPGVQASAGPIPAPRPTSVAAPAAAPRAPQVELPWERGVWVRLLGAPCVTRDGEPVPLRARQIELLAILAVHRDGVTESAARAALWWDEPTTRGAFNNLVSRTRRVLGSYGDEPLLPPAGLDNRYRLAGCVRSDLDLLTTDPLTALAAITGPPFDARDGFSWATRDGHAAAVTARIATAAHDATVAQLAAGRPAVAHRILDLGLRGAPGDQRLLTDRVLAYDLAGNRSAACRSGDALVASVDGDLDALTDDARDTLVRLRIINPRP